MHFQTQVADLPVRTVRANSSLGSSRAPLAGMQVSDLRDHPPPSGVRHLHRMPRPDSWTAIRALRSDQSLRHRVDGARVSEVGGCRGPAARARPGEASEDGGARRGCRSASELEPGRGHQALHGLRVRFSDPHGGFRESRGATACRLLRLAAGRLERCERCGQTRVLNPRPPPERAGAASRRMVRPIPA